MERLVFDGKDKGNWRYQIAQINERYYLLKVKTTSNTIFEMELIEKEEIPEYIECNI